MVKTRRQENPGVGTGRTMACDLRSGISHELAVPGDESVCKTGVLWVLGILGCAELGEYLIGIVLQRQISLSVQIV